ncbi:MAG: AAA family ATPase [Desulfobacterales bacterium]
MDKHTTKAIRRLRSRLIVFGPLFREKGAVALFGTNVPEAVVFLVEALRDKKEQVRHAAYQSLGALQGPAIDRLCALWEENRDQFLKKIILECGYIALKSEALLFKTSYLHGKLPENLPNDGILNSCLLDPENRIRKNVMTHEITNGGDSGFNRLWEIARQNPDSGIAEFLYTSGRYPADTTERALFYFLAGAMDQYRDIDFDQSILRAWYESGALEFFAVTETIDEIGGLDVLKNWLREREICFTQKAADYGLALPKGLLLVGIPGTGKSLTAKVVSGLWRQPLVRLYMGAVFGSLVGQSEENIRRALRLAETVSPCVLWIDEVEKGMADSGGDAGTSSRVFGTLLSWMQDKRKPVFVVFTANDISRIPPEFSRAGRFDATFFLDLPTARERREIFQVHLLKRRPVIETFDIDALAASSEGFVGSEIEQSIIAAMVRAFNDGAKEVNTEDILYVLNSREEVVPLSTSQKDKIGLLRRWLLEGRARSASFPEARSALKQKVNAPDFAAAPDLEL